MEKIQTQSQLPIQKTFSYLIQKKSQNNSSLFQQKKTKNKLVRKKDAFVSTFIWILVLLIPVQATFNPTDNDLVAVSCCSNSPYIILYNVSANIINKIQGYTNTTASNIYGLQFSPVNGSRAIAAIAGSGIQLFTLTPQAIYCEYTLTSDDSDVSIGISPSGNYAVIAIYIGQFILYQITQTEIQYVATQNITSCQGQGAAYVNETIVLIGCNGQNIYQYSVQQSTIVYQAVLLSSSAAKNVYGITFLRGSNINGIYAGFGGQNFYSFTYTYDGSSSQMSSSVILSSFQNDARSAAFSADNTRLILIGYQNNVELYTTGLIAYCSYQITSSQCITCISGNYLTAQYQCQQCNRTCLTCSNNSACKTCIISSPVRNLSNFCACPNSTFDDGINAQCQNCSQLCSTCTNSSQCSTCIGSVSNNSSRRLPNCTCPSIGYFDAFPNYTECQSCLPQCLACNNNFSCSLCVGNTTWNYSRITPQCNCPAKSYSNLSEQFDCIVCLQQCANCTNLTSCLSCIGVQSQNNSRLLNQSCSCPEYGYYDALPALQDCQPCPYNTCLTCTNNTACQTCIGDQNQNYSRLLPDCICPINYYSNTSQQADCIACQPKCENCTSSSICLQCVGIQNSSNSRLLNQSCNCSAFKHFDDFPNQIDCQPCFQNTCLTCINNQSCYSCIGNLSTNYSRLLPECTCPIGFYSNLTLQDDCIACQPKCENCTNSSICLQCVGVQNSSNSRLLNQSCNCSEFNYFDDFPNQIDCQPCFLNTCLTCTNSSSCQSCIGSLSTNYSRLLPDCTCPPKFYSDLSQSPDCLPCPPECATCLNYTFCTSCIGDQNYGSARLVQSQCSCPGAFYSNLSFSQDCLSCPVQCSSCVNYSFCTSCTPQFSNGNLQLSSQSSCPCPTELQLLNTTPSISITLTQQSCLSTCCGATCISGYYFSNTNQSCLQCDASCLTCFNSPTNCTSCNTLNNLLLLNNQCVCKPGFTNANSSSCIPILTTTPLPSNIPVIYTYIAQTDQFPVINIYFPVSLQQQYYANLVSQNLQVYIAQLTLYQDYSYNITASNINFISINIYFYQSIGQVNIQIQFPNISQIPDINNNIIPLQSLNYPFGPYLIPQSQSEKQTIQNIQSTTNTVIKNQFVNALRSVSFIAYFLVSVQMTFNFLLINTVYPQNFYEILSLLCATFISTIPPYNQINSQYTYTIMYIETNIQLQTSIPSLQLYRLGFSGQLIVDANRQIIELVVIWSIFLLVIKKLYKKYQEQIKKGEKKFVNSAYFFIFETIIGMHESIVGITFYCLLMQFSCMTFLNTIGILSFILSVIVCAYIISVSYQIWSILSNPSVQISYISEHYAPLVARQGLDKRPLNTQNYSYIKYFQLLSYLKKSLVIMLIFFGSGSGNFQLISVLIVQAVYIIFLIYIKPYRSHVYTCIKLLTEISIMAVIILLLIATNKLQDLLQESILNNDDVNYVNSLGWAAAWTLCAFNVLSLLMMVVDYIFDFIDYLEKRSVDNKQKQILDLSNNLINKIESQGNENNKKGLDHQIELKMIQADQVQQNTVDKSNNKRLTKNNKFITNNPNLQYFNLNQQNRFDIISFNDPNMKHSSIMNTGIQNQNNQEYNSFQLKNINKRMFFSISQYNQHIRTKQYLKDTETFYKSLLLNNNNQQLTQILKTNLEAQLNFLKEKQNQIFCINRQKTQEISQQLKLFFVQFKYLVYLQNHTPQLQVDKILQLVQQNDQIAQLLFVEMQPDFEQFLDEYGPNFFKQYRLIMINIEQIIDLFINANLELKNVRIVIILFILIQNNDNKDFQELIETFQEIDIFYQDNADYPIILIRGVQNEILYLSRKYKKFNEILINKQEFIVSIVNKQNIQYQEKIIFEFKAVMYQAIDLYIQQSGNQNTVETDYLAEKVYSIVEKTQDVRTAVLQIKAEIAMMEVI